tara:strand:- start:185 stop:1123 length:939 start_codon:yes stop_codon:yes gene_type:complete
MSMSGMGGPVGALNFHSGSSNVWYGVRGVNYGGIKNPQSGFSNNLDYITIQTTGNATSLGGSGTTRVAPAGLSGNGRGLYAGGREAPSNNQLTQIRYMTLISQSSTNVFGQLTTATRHSGGCSDGLRGIYMGGHSGSGMIDYITIASTGNAQDFGDLNGGGNGGAAGNNAVRGVYQSFYNDLQYVTIQSTGNASDFGDYTAGGNRDDNCAATGDEAHDRIVFGPGEGPSASQKRMDYITVSTTGNATEFGNLSFQSIKRGGLSDGSRGMWVGSSTPGYGDRIDYITLANTGNGTDFGNLSEGRSNPGCASGS